MLESQFELELELELTNRQPEQAAPMIIGHLLGPFSALKRKRIQKYHKYLGKCPMYLQVRLPVSGSGQKYLQPGVSHTGFVYLMHIEIIDSWGRGGASCCSWDCSFSASVSPFAAVSAYAFASAHVAVSVSAFAFASVGRVLCRGVRVKLFQSERERRLQTGRQGSAGGA